MSEYMSASEPMIRLPDRVGLANGPAAAGTRTLRRVWVRAASAGSVLGFALFVLVNATLFVRPTELLEGLDGWPIYNVLILGCFAVSWPAVLQQLAPGSLAGRPITVCVFGLLAAVVVSHLSGG